jgi:hypothetical protein
LSDETEKSRELEKEDKEKNLPDWWDPDKDKSPMERIANGSAGMIEKKKPVEEE